jgi:hypothetical protein
VFAAAYTIPVDISVLDWHVVYAVNVYKFENAGTPDTSCDVPDKCILLDTSLEIFLTGTSN